MINNVIVSGVQQSDSVIHIHVSILFQILFPFKSVTTYGVVEEWLTVEQLFLKCTVKHERCLISYTLGFSHHKMVLRIRQMMTHKP